MMDRAVIVAMAVLALLCMLQSARMAFAAAWLRRRAADSAAESDPALATGTMTDPRMWIVVPVYQEQAVVEESWRRFRALTEGRPWLRVVFCTTIREGHEPGSTHDILSHLCTPGCGVHLIRYPLSHGVMAHQVNHAVRWIREAEGGDFVFGLYNVDSVIESATLAHARVRFGEDMSAVLQQYAAYFPAPDGRGFGAGVLEHIALWQTRWSLHFELGRLLVDHAFLGPPAARGALARLLAPFHYVIGHGLWMSRATWEAVGGFPEDELNEDAALGLKLHVRGIRIEPIPALEEAEPPPRLRAYLRQQAVWFNGPFFAWRYAWKELTRAEDRERPPVSATQVLAAGFKLQLHAVYWALGPPLLLLALPATLAWLGQWNLAAGGLALTAWFTWGLNEQARRTLRERNPWRARRRGGILAAHAAYALHCVGPMRMLVRSATGRTTMEGKYKTERHADFDRTPRYGGGPELAALVPEPPSRSLS